MSFSDQTAWPHSTGQVRTPRDFGFAYTPYSGGATTAPQAVNFAGRGDDTAPNHFLYFGFNPQFLEKPAELQYARETQNLPEAFRGPNPFMSKLVITMITNSELWPIREMLPLKRWESGNRVQWEIWKFNDHQMNRRPEQAPSRLVTSQRDVKQDTITSYGIAGVLEHGFMKTPSGRLAYMANLWQFINSALECLCHGAQTAVLFVDYTKNLNATLPPQLGSVTEMRKICERELKFWALLQKVAEGIMLVVQDFKDSFMARLGRPPNYMIMGPGTQQYAANRLGLYVPPDEGSRASKGVPPGITVREFRNIHGAENAPTIQPGRVTIHIGRLFKMTQKFLRGVPGKEYRSSAMDRHVQDLSNNDYAIVRYEQILAYAGLFEEVKTELGLDEPGRADGYARVVKWQLTKGIGEAFFEGYSNWYAYMKETGVLRPWVDSLLSKGASVQAQFLKECNIVGKLRAQGKLTSGGFWTSANMKDFLDDLQLEFADGPPAAEAASEAAAGGAMEGAFRELATVIQDTEAASTAQKFVYNFLRLFNGLQAPRDDYRLRLLKSALKYSAAGADRLIDVVRAAEQAVSADFASDTGLSLMSAASGDVKEDPNPLYLVGFLDLGDAGITAVTVRLPTSVGGTSNMKNSGDNTEMYRFLTNLASNANFVYQKKAKPVLASFQRLIADSVQTLDAVLSGKNADTVRAAIKRDANKMVKRPDVSGRFQAHERRRLPRAETELPRGIAARLADVVHEFEDSVAAIYSKHKATIGGDDRFVALMKCVHAAWDNVRNNEGAKSAMNLLLEEMYFCRFVDEKTMYSEDRMQRAVNKSRDVMRQIAIDIGNYGTFLAAFGAHANEILGKLVPNAMALFDESYMEQKHPFNAKRLKEHMEKAHKGGVESEEVKMAKSLFASKEAGVLDEEDVLTALKALPIDSGNILFFSARNDLWPLVFLAAFAPSGEFVTSPAVAMRAFGEAGKTVYGHNSLELGDDPAYKVHTLHYTLYNKALITDERMIEHRDNIFVHEYRGGWDPTKFWDPNSAEDREAWRAGRIHHKSYFVLPLKPDELEQETVVDMLGRFNPALCPQQRDPLPASGPAAAEFWGLVHGANPLGRLPFIRDMPLYQTMCFEQHTLVPQYQGAGRWNQTGNVILDTGHFGQDWGYPGSADICTLKRMWLERPNFHPASSRSTVLYTGMSSGV